MRLAAFAERRLVSRNARMVKYVRPVPVETASGLVSEVYRQVDRDFQLATPITVHSLLPRLLAAFWCVMRETFLGGAVPRLHKEAIAAAVSRANACPYCVDAHVMMLDGGGLIDASAAITAGRAREIPDSSMRALVQWALEAASPGSGRRDRPFDTAGAPEIIGTAVGFHYINRMVTVFLGDSMLGLPPAMRWLKRPISRVGAAIVGRRVKTAASLPGESLRLLPDAPLPPEFRWAASNPMGAAAWARMAAAVQEIEATLVPRDVRASLRHRLELWDGEPMGLSRTWVEAEPPIAQLALLTALSPWQVDAGIVQAARAAGLGDDGLVGVVSWAAFAVTRRIASWQ